MADTESVVRKINTKIKKLYMHTNIINILNGVEIISRGHYRFFVVKLHENKAGHETSKMDLVFLEKLISSSKTYLRVMHSVEIRGKRNRSPTNANRKPNPLDTGDYRISYGNSIDLQLNQLIRANGPTS